jgi:hypothetical protein
VRRPADFEAAPTRHQRPPSRRSGQGLQRGRSVIPKSTKRRRIVQNIHVHDFELSADEMAVIDTLDTGRRAGPEPEAITLETFGREIPEA